MILVTGGTGSFGHAFVKRHHGTQHIRVLSRDEEKQRAMAREFPLVDYILGDVRDYVDVRRAMRDVDRVFHAAALKQVPPLEAAPMQAILTNAIGTDNVCRAAEEGRARVVTISTDKAVEPVGVMGATKMLAESITTSYGFNVVRYGNVIGSRGSILPVWREQMDALEPITITDPEMTRFLITMEEALDLIDLAMEAAPDGAVYVKRSPAGAVAQFARVYAPGWPVRLIGPRPGEKRHECLVVADEPATEHGDHYIIRRNGPGSGITYGSDLAPRLSDHEMAALFGVAPMFPAWTEAFG